MLERPSGGYASHQTPSIYVSLVGTLMHGLSPATALPTPIPKRFLIATFKELWIYSMKAETELKASTDIVIAEI